VPRAAQRRGKPLPAATFGTDTLQIEEKLAMNGTNGGPPKPKPQPESQAEPEDIDEERDEALEETFPASDPPATGGSTGPDDR
jgi:hypothetical protein